MDCMRDTLATGRVFRSFNVVDDCTREPLAMDVDTSFPGSAVAAVLTRLVAARGRPDRIVCDYGPEFICCVPQRVLRNGAAQLGWHDRPRGLLVRAEMDGRTVDSLLGAPLSDWHRAVLRLLDDVPAIVAHELVHYPQRGSGPTRLEAARREGIADFVGERVSGTNRNSVALLGKGLPRWLYNSTKSVDRPADAPGDPSCVTQPCNRLA
jgi:hypothetical protein